MKQIIFILTLIISSNIYSQTTTEKYNSTMQQYEYFDSNGNMVGYKKYNSIMRQWEYYTVGKKASNSYNQEYINPVDYNLVNNSLAYKQNKYESNESKIRSKIDNINKAFQLFYDYKDVPAISKRKDRINSLVNSFADGVDKINAMNYDFSSNSTTQQILTWIDQYETSINSIIREIKQESN